MPDSLEVLRTSGIEDDLYRCENCGALVHENEIVVVDRTDQQICIVNCLTT